MQKFDATSLNALSTQLESLRANLGVVKTGPIVNKPPAPAFITTQIRRGTTTIGYVVTGGSDPQPTSASSVLKAGTLWIEASLFGASFTGETGFVAVPFASATLTVSGAVIFSDGVVEPGAAATLGFTATSPALTAPAAAASGPGVDYANTKLSTFPHAGFAFAPSGVAVTLQGAGSATIYGQALTLSPLAGATAVKLVGQETYCAIPCTAAQTKFTVSSSASPEVRIGGAAPVTGASVIFPLVAAASSGAPALPDPEDAWGLAVGAGLGLTAVLGGVSGPLALAGAAFAVTPSRLIGLIATGNEWVQSVYGLWAPAVPPTPAPATLPVLELPASTLVVEFAPSDLVWFTSTPGAEVSVAGVTIDVLLDQPLNADGNRIALAGPALVTRTRSAAGVAIEVISGLTPKATTSLALMAENALVPVGTPNGFILLGQLSAGSGAGQIAGLLEIGFPPVGLVPTLPDPYAATYFTNLREQFGPYAGVTARVQWDGTTAAVLAIQLVDAAGTTGSTQTGIGVTAVAGVGVGARLVQMLDVSGNADQWGVGVGTVGKELAFDGLQLTAPSQATTVFTVPGISWEPVVNPPQWLQALSPDDGELTTFLVMVPERTPLMPVEALELYKDGAVTVATDVVFTLPFGITAHLTVDSPKPTAADPKFAVPKLVFANPLQPGQNLTGARVLSITAGAAPPLQASLPGSADLQATYGAIVLDGTAVATGPKVSSFWTQDFGASGAKKIIPISRVDLSGYGTSLFSDWHDPIATDTGILRALFNVLLGRTAHEIITAQTWILPWCVRLQRTITFDRSDGGAVVRHDTGWHAVAAGTFELLGSQLLAGPVQSVNNIRDLSFGDTAQEFGTIQYYPCTFEADVALSGSLFLAANGKPFAANLPPSGDANYVPPTAVGKGIQGYALATIPLDASNKPVVPSATEILQLMQSAGTRVTGSTGCVVRAGGGNATQFTMAVSSFAAAVAEGTTPKLQTAVFGTPSLPKDGQWSVSRRSSGVQTPVSVGSTPVPLTQATSAGTTPPSGPGTFGATAFRLLDPEDAQQPNTPATFYGLLQGTGTAKTLFEHPLINQAGTGFGFNNNPVLADIGALLGIAGLFPDIGNALKIPSTHGLPIVNDGFSPAPYNIPAPSSPRTLIKLGIADLVLDYGPPGSTLGTLTIDASTTPSSWALELDGLTFQLNVNGFGAKLVTVSGKFHASSTAAPGFSDLKVSYSSVLQTVTDVLSGLAAVGGSSVLDVGFVGDALSVLQDITLPTLPLGFGDIANIALDLGFTANLPDELEFSIGIGSRQEPFQWIVSPLSGTGAIVFGVDNGGMDFFIEAGIGAGLSLNVAVASGSASIVVSFALDIGTSDITLTVALTGNAQVDVLGGLASASLTLSAAISIEIESLTKADITAQVAVGIHISICWVISISFDGSWSMSETVSL